MLAKDEAAVVAAGGERRLRDFERGIEGDLAIADQCVRGDRLGGGEHDDGSNKGA